MYKCIKIATSNIARSHRKNAICLITVHYVK